MAEIEFRLLGPLEVWRDGRRVEVGGAKARALLAILLLHAGEVVSADRLIDALWGERAPSSGTNALQQHIAHLRRALDCEGTGGLLVTRPPGYMLDVAYDALDVWRFERLIDDGRDALADDPAAASELLREALGLWRGPALAEFAFDQFAQPDAARLEELRLVALEDRIDADLRLGRHHELVPELEALVGRQPFRERLAGELMSALYRCERQADASRVYHATRARLVEELGIEPGAPLRELHQRVLDQDPALASPEPARGRGAASVGDEATPHNLPVELTSFIGRESELRELSELLPKTRLLTLTGPGGSGKTRLALRLARDALDRYPDGVRLVELAALAEAALVAKAVAAAVGVREGPESLIETLKQELRDAQLLLVLDNCEHLVGACAELAQTLLTGCEGVRILATSREPLGVAGEHTWPVHGLAIPDRLVSPGEADRYAAVRLFAERAAATKPRFALDNNSAAAASEVCRRLDGMPLAIELAAARVRVLSPTEIEQRLSDRFALLTGGNRGAAARQQTLRATVAWSHDLLEEYERTLFRRVSVFAGGWTAALAEQVSADERLPQARIFEILCALVEKSLVAGEALADGSTRYRMLETLREYGRQQLEAGGERDELRRRHFSTFLELAERSRELKLSTGADTGLAVLRREQDNLRAALTFARNNDPHGLLRLATAMDQLWHAGQLADGRRWIEEALARSPEPSRERARALHVLASLTDLRQGHDEARELAKQAIVLSNRFGDQTTEAWARLTLGLIEFTAANYTEASQHLEQARAAHQALGQLLGVERAGIYSGVVLTMAEGGREAGGEQLRQALQTAQQLEDRWGEGFALLFLGWVDFDADDRALAATRFRGVLMTEALGPIRAGGLGGLAALACQQNPRRALRLLAAGASHRERQGGRPPPVIKRKETAVRAQAEQQLDRDAAEQAWNEGLSMSTDEAIAYALEDHQQHPAPPHPQTSANPS